MDINMIREYLNNMTYDEMKLASGLSANLINGVRVVPDTPSPKVNALLSELKKRSRNDVIYVTQYINRCIVDINEADNEPSDDAQRIYDEMMWD